VTVTLGLTTVVTDEFRTIRLERVALTEPIIEPVPTSQLGQRTSYATSFNIFLLSWTCDSTNTSSILQPFDLTFGTTTRFTVGGPDRKMQIFVFTQN
jgi:hypothetical protein